MTPEEWEDRTWSTALRWGVGLAGLLALLILSLFPFSIAHIGDIRPAFLLMAVYYGTILSARFLPPPLVFALGLALDLLSAGPLGMQALVLVLAQWLTRQQRKFLLGQPFAVIWAGFVLLAAGAGLLQWGLVMLFNTALLPLKPVVMGVVLSVALFPLLALLLARVRHFLAAAAAPAED